LPQPIWSRNQPHGTIAMSLLYSDRNQLDKERNLLTTQLARTPNDAVTIILMAELLIRSGAVPGQPAFEEAKAHLQTSLAAKPDSVEGQNLMAKTPCTARPVRGRTQAH